MGAPGAVADPVVAPAGDLPQACGMQCHACQSEVPLAAGESIGFRESCGRCGADLHVCLCCAHHDPTAYNDCREPNAERILDPDRANRCDYFRPAATSAGGEGGRNRDAAMSALEDLFKKG